MIICDFWHCMIRLEKNGFTSFFLAFLVEMSNFIKVNSAKINQIFLVNECALYFEAFAGLIFAL